MRHHRFKLSIFMQKPEERSYAITHGKRRVPQTATTMPVCGVVGLADVEPGQLPKQIPEVVGTVRFQCDHLKSFRLYPNIFREVLARYAATEEAKDV